MFTSVYKGKCKCKFCKGDIPQRRLDTSEYYSCINCDAVFCSDYCLSEVEMIDSFNCGCDDKYKISHGKYDDYERCSNCNYDTFDNEIHECSYCTTNYDGIIIESEDVMEYLEKNKEKQEEIYELIRKEKHNNNVNMKRGKGHLTKAAIISIK
jgi:hypothetical protein